MLFSGIPYLRSRTGTGLGMSSHDVFICYSARDKTVATAICAVLEAEGVRCWMAPRDIVPGADWGESIIDAINDAKAMVLVFSSNANDAQQQIKREVERAVNKGMPVIPFRIENVMPTKSLEYFLSTPHWLDAFTPPLDDHVRQLADSIKRLLGKQAAERPVLVKPATPAPTMAALAHHLRIRRHGEGFKIGGVPFAEWVKKPVHAAHCRWRGRWFCCSASGSSSAPPPSRKTSRPGMSRRWKIPFPAISFTCAKMPQRLFLRQGRSRAAELKAEVDERLRQGQGRQHAGRLYSFLNTYAKQGVDLDEARERLCQCRRAGKRRARRL